LRVLRCDDRGIGAGRRRQRDRERGEERCEQPALEEKGGRHADAAHRSTDT
jgi:hypothetical protein